jgi:hypothetical protein
MINRMAVLQAMDGDLSVEEDFERSVMSGESNPAVVTECLEQEFKRVESTGFPAPLVARIREAVMGELFDMFRECLCVHDPPVRCAPIPLQWTDGKDIKVPPRRISGPELIWLKGSLNG